MLIEFFPDGSVECPLVLLHGRDPAAAARLREKVVALAAEQVQRVAVHEIPGFESVGGCQLFASTGRSDLGTQPLCAGRVFECQLRPVTWHDVEGLLEPFTEQAFCDGFQWLDSHGEIQLLISGHRGW
ncbi:MAG: hypothetical protein HZC54_21205 [Verrucomicrobia bacterium]|nr:hypothetical protein [Verrucomicrobiota bacterium]